MSFRCALRRPSKGSPTGASLLPGEEVDYQSLIMDACSLLSQTDCRFLMAGFGDDDWGVDVAYDLSVVLEQLPLLLAGLRGGADVELDIYSQGMERTLQFGRRAGQVLIHCLSQTSWVPDPDTEILPFDDLEVMLVQLAVDFSMSLELVSPEMSSAPPFPEWRTGEV